MAEELSPADGAIFNALPTVNVPTPPPAPPPAPPADCATPEPTAASTPSTKHLLDAIAQRDTGARGQGIADGIDKYRVQYAISTPLRLAHFLAQACEETDGFRDLHEMWGPTSTQQGYEGRADLGNNRPGDGFLYRGRGIFELTGRANYAREGAALGLPLETEPELAADPVIAVRIACDYWQHRNINAAADADDIVLVTRLINGGENGLSVRQACLTRAKTALGIA